MLKPLCVLKQLRNIQTQADLKNKEKLSNNLTIESKYENNKING